LVATYERSTIIMSRIKDKGKDHESHMSSDSEDGLDIVQATRKGLDLSQYIDGQPVSF